MGSGSLSQELRAPGHRSQDNFFWDKMGREVSFFKPGFWGKSKGLGLCSVWFLANQTMLAKKVGECIACLALNLTPQTLNPKP